MHKMEICYRVRICKISQNPEDGGYYTCKNRNKTAKKIQQERESTPFSEKIKKELSDKQYEICHAANCDRNMCYDTAFSDHIIETYTTEDEHPYAFTKTNEEWNIHLPNGKDLWGELVTGNCIRDNYFLVWFKFDDQMIFDNSDSAKEIAIQQTNTQAYPLSKTPYDCETADDSGNKTDNTVFAQATTGELVQAQNASKNTPSYKNYKFNNSDTSKGFNHLMTMFAGVSADNATPAVPIIPVIATPPVTTPPTSPFVAYGAQPPIPPQTPQTPPISKTSSSEYFKDPALFTHDVSRFIKFKDRKTGFANLDAIQPFYPGLITIGAVSSLGKTTLLCQLVENLAMAGEHIIYFSLEQTPFELLTKSIARRTYTEYLNDPSMPHYSSIQLRRGDWLETDDTKAYVLSHIDRYCQDIEERITVVNTPFSLTVEGIKTVIEEYIQKNSVVPTVVVDYLQIVAATMENNRTPDTRTSIDHIVHELKILQIKYDLTILLVSALNRQNYMNTIDMESFRESSGIEYTSDMIVGLELEVLAHDNIFNTDSTKKISQKRLIIQAAKASNPRDIAYVVLKNRGGMPTYRVNFKYYPAYDLFMPCDAPTDYDLQVAVPELTDLMSNEK